MLRYFFFSFAKLNANVATSIDDVLDWLIFFVLNISVLQVLQVLTLVYVFFVTLQYINI